MLYLSETQIAMRALSLEIGVKAGDERQLLNKRTALILIKLLSGTPCLVYFLASLERLSGDENVLLSCSRHLAFVHWNFVYGDIHSWRWKVLIISCRKVGTLDWSARYSTHHSIAQPSDRAGKGKMIYIRHVCFTRHN